MLQTSCVLEIFLSEHVLARMTNLLRSPLVQLWDGRGAGDGIFARIASLHQTNSTRAD